MLTGQISLVAKAEEEVKRRLLLHEELVWLRLVSVPHLHLDLISKKLLGFISIQGCGAANSFLPFPVFLDDCGRFFIVTSSGIRLRLV